MTTFFLKWFLNDWFYCNWLRKMRDKYVSWKIKFLCDACMYFCQWSEWLKQCFFSHGPSVKYILGFFSILNMFSQVSVRLSSKYNSVEIMSVFCLFPCLLKRKRIPTSNYEIKYTISDKKNRRKNPKPMYIWEQPKNTTCLLCKWNALVMNKSGKWK